MKEYNETNVKSFNFKVDRSLCTKCGICLKTCGSGVLELGADGYPKMRDGADGILGWGGCYRCQHCLAVCPKGAIEILGKKPEDSVLPSHQASPEALEALMRNRRAVRRFLDKEVPRETIDHMLRLLENVPTGSNNQSLNFQVVYAKAEMDKFRRIFRDRAFELAGEGIFPQDFTESMWQSQVDLEPKRNPGDMFFLNAPHLLVIHSKKNLGQWQIDPLLATAWFDLICASHGIGSCILTFPVRTMVNMPEVKEMLKIDDDRYFTSMMVFGYPEIPYQRGVQREGIAEVTELKF